MPGPSLASATHLRPCGRRGRRRRRRRRRRWLRRPRARAAGGQRADHSPAADDAMYSEYDCTVIEMPRALQYTVEFIELTSAVPFTLAQLKEFTLARGFIPSLHGATTLPVSSHPSGGVQPCPLALSRVLAALVSQLTAQLPDAYSHYRQSRATTVFVHSTMCGA